jgi:hypothetical protein
VKPVNALFRGCKHEIAELTDTMSKSVPTTIATAVPALRPALITIPAACQYLNISKSSFYDHVLPHLEIVHLLSNKPLIKLDSLDRFIAAKTVAPKSSE